MRIERLRIANLNYPLVPGTAFSYRDRVYVDGSLVEDTFDWYAPGSAPRIDKSLAPGSRGYKFYAPGVGLVMELSPAGGRGRVELISVSRP